MNIEPLPCIMLNHHLFEKLNLMGEGKFNYLNYILTLVNQSGLLLRIYWSFIYNIVYDFLDNLPLFPWLLSVKF